MSSLHDALSGIGLSKEEIIVYQHVLTSAADTILHIAAQTGIPRTTVYLLVESLLKKRLIVEQERGKKKIYHASPPDEILNYAKAKKRELTDTISTLEQEVAILRTQYQSAHGKPGLHFAEGHAEITSMLLQVAQSKELFMMQTVHETNNEPARLWHGFFEVIKNELPIMRILAVENTDLLSAIEQDDHCIVHILPPRFAGKVDVLIGDAMVINIIFKESHCFAIGITDPAQVLFEKSRFMMLWHIYDALKHLS